MEENVPAVVATQAPMSIDELKGNVALVQQVMKEVMHEGEHWGTIPGCKKPSLFKAGAEKLTMTFRLVHEIDVEVIELPNEHREYRIKVTTFNSSGARLGQGVGSCSTMEGKYRFRTGEKNITDRPVPKDYWTHWKKDPPKAQAMLGAGNGKGKGEDGKWYITEGGGEKVEHDNPADYYNTCLKMAKKRGVSDVVLTVTAASDIFTQDIEDMPEVIPGAAQVAEKKESLEEGVVEAETEDVPAEEATASDKIDAPDSKGDATDKQVEAIKKLLKALHIKEDHDQCQDVSDTLGFKDAIADLSFLDKTHASIIIPSLGERLDAKKEKEKAQ